jgi:hypothetical protein
LLFCVLLLIFLFQFQNALQISLIQLDVSLHMTIFQWWLVLIPMQLTNCGNEQLFLFDFFFFSFSSYVVFVCQFSVYICCVCLSIFCLLFTSTSSTVTFVPSFSTCNCRS